MEYKIFKGVYNDGEWRSGDLPHFFYIARNENEVATKSQKYKEFLEWSATREEKYGYPAYVYICEVDTIIPERYFENIEDFDISVTIKEKE